MTKKATDMPGEEVAPVEESTSNEDAYKDKYLRAQADYHNLEQRMHKDIEEKSQQKSISLIMNMLEILDDLDQAEVFVHDPGLKLVKNKVMKIFEGQGVQEIDCLGKPFDPYVAECIEVVEGDKDDIVSDVLQKGYTYKDKVLRPARVRVMKKT